MSSRVNAAQSSTLTLAQLCTKQMRKICYKNIPAYQRYCYFHVGVFFGSPCISGWWLECICLSCLIDLTTVGEEDEVSIKEVAEMIVEAMNFTGEVQVSFSCFRNVLTLYE